MQAAATQPMPAGRPPKYAGEKTHSLSIRLPESVLKYLGLTGTQQREGAIKAVLFERELSTLTEDILADLRISAAREGLSHEEDRAENIARLLRLALACEKKSRK